MDECRTKPTLKAGARPQLAFGRIAAGSLMCATRHEPEVLLLEVSLEFGGQGAGLPVHL